MRIFALILILGVYLFAEDCVCPEIPAPGIEIPDYHPDPEQQFYDSGEDEPPTPFPYEDEDYNA